MRLQRIEAVRFGELENGCLSDLSRGLTVVLGPNESGKSTFTALTRHVLYGYPYAHAKERGYLPASGSRAARLVFADDVGTWAIERVDGPKRGPYKVTALDGAERPGLLEEIVGGVSEQTFRVVFGFGLDELAQIESAESADVVARLYAAGTGLEVNPLDVRKHVEALASELYAPRASKPQVNALAAGIKGLKDRIRLLEAEATSYATEQGRLRELTEQLSPLKQQRDELEVGVRTLARDFQRAQDTVEQLSAARDAASALDQAIEESKRSVELIDVDERVLAAGPALAAVLDDTSGFKARLDALAAAEASAAEVDRSISGLPAMPETVTDSPEDRAAVERWRDQLADARRESDGAQRAAQQAEARAEQSALVEQEQPAAIRAPRPVVQGALAVAVGLAAVLGGVLMSQWIAVGLGVLVLIGGGVTLLRPGTPGSPPTSLSAETARLRADALASRQIATEADALLTRLTAEWGEWLEQRGLGAWGEDPAAVRELLVAAQDRRRLAATRNAHLATAARERSGAEEWIVRLVDVVRTFDEAAGQLPTLTGALELAARSRATLERAQDARSERSQLLGRIEALDREKRSVSAKADGARQVLIEIAQRRSFELEDLLPELESAVNRAEEDLTEIRDRYETLAEQAAQLRGQLDDEGRDDQMARARQELEGLRVEASAAADRYTVLALAVRLLDRARERFERERQPEVVRTAARVFSAMTGGRYADVRVPLDDTGVSVVGADGAVRPSEQLSRGTAEQLYLALRVGLIGSLGEMGRSLPILMDDVVVNFDPERRAGAASAVRELANARQVIFFTCHPETAALLEQQVPGAKLVTLDRCTLR